MILAAVLAVGACAEPMNGASDTGVIQPLPEEVARIAAPNQDLASARLLDDGCYWYSYSGPVETTLLPLRARGGGQICGGTRAAI
ncbi:hypothetical protein [Roseovarius sp. SCSIO 43702]|uniref:hypothetical protein n=1 Tax=Roseovarius sp. SCSIO 43702 TaxID=2823043 RepID=UPI0021761A1D|nr:hypothetical protein [Roseovarius sp. SCSIO 43702]